MVDFGLRALGGEQLPVRLNDLPWPPAEVHVMGELPRGPGVAIVGTRHASAEARRFAFGLARDLARAGVAVFSGGAEGIDAAAHLGALRGRAPTVVVAPAGFYRPFPEEHQRLFERVLAHGGAYVSLRRPYQSALRGGFFARNGCLVALAHVVVVIEARYRSGARNAAKWARRLGRPLLAVPNAPWVTTGRGCLVELQLGAKVCMGPRDVLTVLEAALAFPPRPEPRAAERAAEERALEERSELAAEQTELPFAASESAPAAAPVRDSVELAPEFGLTSREQEEACSVLAAVRAGARHLDAVCERSGLSTAVAQRLILTLTLGGVLAADPTGSLGVTRTGGSVSARKSLK
jgi:DNA processing protein